MPFTPLYVAGDITRCMVKQGMKYDMECPSHHKKLIYIYIYIYIYTFIYSCIVTCKMHTHTRLVQFIS